MFTFSHVSFKRDTCCSITLFKNDWDAYLYVLFKNDWLTCHYVLLKRDWHACHYMLFKNFAQKGLARLPLAMCHGILAFSHVLFKRDWQFGTLCHCMFENLGTLI